MPKRIVSALLLVSLSLALCLPVRGAEPELELESPSAILMDAATGTVLFEQDADTPMEPASVTKVMTLLLVMEALDRGEISMDAWWSPLPTTAPPPWQSTWQAARPPLLSG